MEVLTGAGKLTIPSPEDAAVRLILESETFRKAKALRRLLSYLWEQRGQTPNEYSIAVDALDRRSGFDPRLDASVRVHVARLRQKLKEYYETEGAQSDVIFSIPPGVYRLEFEQASGELPIEIPPPRQSRVPVEWRYCAWIASAVALASMALALHYGRQAEHTAAQLELPRFWSSFFSNGQPVKLIMPTPVFFDWPNLRVRDVLVDDFAGYQKSSSLSRLVEEFGPPKLSQTYTVASDSLAAVRLAQFTAARGHYLDVAVTGDLSLELFTNHNLILMGIPHTNGELRRFQAKTNFEADNGRVVNHHPTPQEPAVWQTTAVPGKRQIRPGLIGLLPGQAAGTRLLLIVGGHTASLISFLISPAGLRALDEVWARNGSPDYFELVVTAEVENNSVIKAQPVAFRRVPASLWK